MHETHDAMGPRPQVETKEAAKSLKTIDLGIDGLAPAVHLGAGGSANVFAAKQMETGEAVAVKLLRASADSEKERTRFEREQETLKRLVTHDGIVPVLDAGLTDREEPYFLMPLMEGSLQDRIDRDGALDWQTATQLIAEVADTVSFAHEQSVLHRDIKPGNILLDREGIPRVADFGIAKLLDSQHSKSSKSLGTPSFMPPERFNGLEATEESDVYGLGATLAALITGTAPFLTGANDTDAAVMMRVVTEAPPTLDNLDVPEEVRMAVQSSMAKDPADRPATAAEFAQQLRMAIDPHLDPALAGPVTVAVPRRNISIPDGPITQPGTGSHTGSGSADTIDLTAQEEEEHRKFPIWLAAAVVAVIALIGGVLGVNAITGDENPQAFTSDVNTGDEDAVTDEGDDPAAGSGGDGSDDDGNSDDGGDDNNGEGTDDTANTDGQLLGTDDEDPDNSDGIAGGEQIETEVEGTQETNTDGTGTETAPEVDVDDTTTTTTIKQDSTEEPPETTSTVATTQPPPPKPEACFSATKSKVETGQTVSFSNCSTDATSYSWDLAGSSSTASSPSKSWATAGVKTVKLTARGPGGSDTMTLRVTVSETPPPPTKPTACFNAPSTAETGQSINLSNCSTDATSYRWDLDGATSTAQSPSMRWNSAGTKTIKLTATGPGGTHTATKTVTVKTPIPPAEACFSANKTTIEEGQSVTFTNCSKNAKSYWWEFGDGGTSSQASPTRTYANHGTYTVKLTANGDGGNDTATKTITVNQKPVTGDERVRPKKIGCTTVGPAEWIWSWETLPSWVNDYQIKFSNGSTQSLGRQPASYRTTKTVTQIIAIDKNNIALASNVPACAPFAADVPTPSGISCKFSNFRMEDGRWTWNETWSWANGGSGVSHYLVRVENNGGLGGEQNPNNGGRSHLTNPTNGAPNSGLSLKQIIAVGTDGTKAVRTISTCGSEGGTGWQSPPK